MNDQELLEKAQNDFLKQGWEMKLEIVFKSGLLQEIVIEDLDLEDADVDDDEPLSITITHRKYSLWVCVHVPRNSSVQLAEGLYALKRMTEHAPLDAIMRKAADKSQEDLMDQRELGIIPDKFTVTRKDGKDKPGGSHAGNWLFVLDLAADPHALPAIRAYAESCKDDYPVLAEELLEAAMLRESGKGG